MGFFRGLTAPFRGGAYIFRQGLMRYLVAPVLVNLALGIGTLVAAARYWREDLSHMLATTPVLGGILLFVATILLSAVLFILLQPVVSAVFCDRLSEVVEKRVRGTAPSAPFLSSAGRALVHGLLKLVLYGVALAVGLLLTAPLAGLGTLVGLALGGLFLAYDGFDYPLGRRGATFGAKWRYLALNPGLTAGYGISATLLYMIPLGMFVAPPFVAVGATLAFLDSDTRATEKAAAKVARAQTVAQAQSAKKSDAKSDANPDAKPDEKLQEKPVDSPEKGQEGQHNPIDISAS